MSPSLRTAMEERLNYHKEFQEKKQEAENIMGNCGKINCFN